MTNINFDKNLYSHLINSINYCIAIIDKDSFVQQANTFFLDRFGDCLGKPLSQVSPHFDEKTIGRLFEMLEDNITNIKLKKIVKEGKIISEECEFSLAPIEATNFFMLSIVDTSETALLRQEYSTLFENTSGFINIIDNEYNIVRTNQNFRNLFGDVETNKLYTIYGKKKSNLTTLAVYQTFNDGKIHIASQNIISISGKKIFMVTTAIPIVINDGIVEKVMEISNDITELTSIQDMFNKHSEFFQDVFHKCYEGVIIVRDNQQTAMINQSARELLSWDKKKKPPFSYIYNSLPREVFELHSIENEPMTLRLNNRKHKDIMLNSFVLSNNSGRLILLRKDESSKLKSFQSLDKTSVKIVKLEKVIYSYTDFMKNKKENLLSDISETMQKIKDKDLKYNYYLKRNNILLYDEVLYTFTYRLNHLTRRRTYINTQTIISKLDKKLSKAFENMPIDIIYKDEFSHNVLVNTKLIVDALYVLAVGLMLDIQSNIAVIGTIRFYFKYNKRNNLEVTIEDNYLDAKEAITSEDDFSNILNICNIFANILNAKITYSGKEYHGRKITIIINK